MMVYNQATADDYAQLLALNEAAIPAVNRIDTGELEHLHQQCEVLLTARQGDRLAGFAAGHGARAQDQAVSVRPQLLVQRAA